VVKWREETERLCPVKMVALWVGPDGRGWQVICLCQDSGEVKIYYGAADTCECLATVDIGDLLKLLKK